MLKKVFYVVVIISLLFVAGGLFLPRNVHVERSIELDRPAATVFTVLNAFRHFEAWSPWAGRDPSARYELSGPAEGVGARLSWSGNPRLIGTGWQEIVASEPFRRIVMQLEFEQNGVAESYFNIEETGQGTRLTWGFDTDLVTGRGWFDGLVSRYSGLFVDRWIGADYEAGLARIEAFVEALPPADFSDLDVAVVDVQPQDILFVRLDDMPESLVVANRLDAAYREISGFMATHEIERSGEPLTITRGRAERGFSLEAAVPAIAAAVEPAGHVQVGRSPGGRAVRAIHHGPHGTIAATYDKLAAWMAAHGFEEGRVSWEHYISDPSRTPPGERLTHIYALLPDAS
jgi:effector-binding domain-containing protein